jgi:hypothetical protein
MPQSFEAHLTPPWDFVAQCGGRHWFGVNVSANVLHKAASPLRAPVKFQPAGGEDLCKDRGVIVSVWVRVVRGRVNRTAPSGQSGRPTKLHSRAGRRREPDQRALSSFRAFKRCDNSPAVPEFRRRLP